RWQDDRIDVWVPFSAKSGPVVIYRGATMPNPDGLCCATKETLKIEAGVFTLVTPKVDSFSPQSGGLDDLITIKGPTSDENIWNWTRMSRVRKSCSVTWRHRWCLGRTQRSSCECLTGISMVWGSAMSSSTSSPPGRWLCVAAPGMCSPMIPVVLQRNG